MGALQSAVLGWYDVHGRRLPFRGTTDPYLVLVSEVILQQTQVSRGAPAWAAFTARFPTVEALAAASPASVLRAWAGLGYNRRALYLQRAARQVAGELGGRFPADLEGLERLPGVGPYTARAVASIAFGLPVAAVDTNVRRVVSRIATGEASALTPGRLQAIADALVPADRPADWTHALMDLGSRFCRPRDPRCAECPARPSCRLGSGATLDRSREATARERRPAVGERRPAVREATAGYRSTSRWLRGRIVDRLRAADGDGWVRMDEPIGGHDAAAVAVALRALASEGLADVEAEPTGSLRARLPQT